MKHSSRRHGSTGRRFHDACGGRDEHAQQDDAKLTPPEQHPASFAGLLKSIFGVEKIERLLTAVRFSFGDAIFHRVAGGYTHVRRFGLLLVLLFLQSLFIAIDYLPVTLEILGRDRACTYLPAPQDKPTEQSGR